MRAAAVVTLVGLCLQVGVALAAAPLSGTYVGSTSQKHPIQIDVKGGKVVSIVYGVYYACKPSAIGRPLQRTTVTTPLTITNGKFGGKVKLPVNGTAISDSTTLRGTFHGSKVTGTFSELFVAGPIRTCRSGTVSFTASRR